MPRNDDGTSGPVAIGFTINFYGRQFTTLFVNNNGNITFGASLLTYIPFDLTATGRSIIAPFFADVDTRNAGNPVSYGSGEADGYPAFGASWIDVDCFFSSSERSQRNWFQLVLIERSDTGPGDFDFELNYDQIQWEPDESSPSGSNCLGVGPARAGFASGTSEPGTSFELPGSGILGAFLDDGPPETALIHNRRNSGIPGRYRFSVRNGVVVPYLDRDGDGISDLDDSCPDIANPGQEDRDGDGLGDACDECPADAENDADGDGVCGDVDFCPGTVLPEQGVPSQYLIEKHWADVDGDRVFDTKPVSSNDAVVPPVMTVADTGGCSCTQILDVLRLGDGQRKYGCSIGTMSGWITMVAGRQASAQLEARLARPGSPTAGCHVPGRAGAASSALVLLGLAPAVRQRHQRHAQQVLR